MRVGDSWRKLASNDLAVLVLWAKAGVLLHTVTNGQYGFHSGVRFLISSLKLRERLEQVYKLYPKTKDMVLISYSLGGLLAQMQAVTIGRVLWDDVFQGDADRLYASVPRDNLMKRALIFDAD
jgi:hypothetical protein